LDFPGLLQIILEEYRLPLDGIHGIAHWARVLENGERLAEKTGAQLIVVQLFAVFHDSRRRNESFDPGHGKRGAEFARSLLGNRLLMDPGDFDLLYRACVGHTDGRIDEDITVQTCWDSDRLDLGRVGIQPVPERLCTAAARRPEIIRWAVKRSEEGCASDHVLQNWGLTDLDIKHCGNVVV